MNDTIDLYPGVPRVFNILANDSIPAGSYVKLVSLGGAGHVQCLRSHDSTWTWTFTFTVPFWGYGGNLLSKYSIATIPMDTSSAYILFRIHDKSYSYLDINNVNARFSASGSHFFYDTAQYEVPKGSGKTSMFSNTMWIGGKDGQGQVHFAGERYRQGPVFGPAGTCPDFYAGPVMDSTKYSIYQDTIWNYIWNLKKSDIDYHRAHFTDAGYTPIHDILTWPGNGKTSLGQAPQLAPYIDENENSIYDPLNGDYPAIRGDQALFFIFNDDRGQHYESQGAKLRVEIHGMAYAYDMPEDSALKNTVFLYYRLYNRSQTTYDSTLLGIFSDIDLGYANDDYVGCDVERSMYFGYNGMPIDGTGQSNAYGENPPTQSVTLLAGPYMDADGIDNPRYDLNGNQLCDFSVNGLNFGDSVADNERFGLQRFLYINNSNSGVPSYMQDPNYAPEYYQLLCGKWKNGTTMVYGGNGSPTAGGYGPECRFMFPGESDTLNWGVGCAPPNGPVNWTEETAKNNPGDRRGLGVTGPVTFKPGDIQEVDLAFSWARDYTSDNPLGSLAKLRLITDKINKAFASNRLPDGTLINGFSDQHKPCDLLATVYPNPSRDQLTIKSVNEFLPANTVIDLVTTQGSCVQSIVTTNRTKLVHLDISQIPPGVYFIRIKTGEGQVVKKAVVMH
ncbi:MAG: T9SS type A sorting domain-containing protein [Bacteroidetes bacterium]|nr:T9SS type A sorting domain-containing protein [Bacteroidota bacterium]